MSYCRWSCLDGYCDVYVYADVSGGWTTHVAGRRIPEGAPPSPAAVVFEYMERAPEDSEGAAALYVEAQQARETWSAANPHFEINHPEAGASFNHATPDECADNLERLRGEGFVVPDWAIDDLRAEQVEIDNE